MNTKTFARKLRALMPRPLELLDVGASGGFEEPWLSFRELVQCVSYDGVPDSSDVEETILYKKSCPVELNITNSWGYTSLYKPNNNFTRDFPSASDLFVKETKHAEAKALDDLGVGRIDFANIDVQGADLDVLIGGKESLKSLVGLQIEVEFQPLYQGQPMFSDVDKYVRENLKLELHDIYHYYWKYTAGQGFGPTKGKLICGDALYLKSPNDVVAYDDVGLIFMACIVGCVYGYFDYVLAILEKTYRHRDLKKLVHDYSKSFRYRGFAHKKLATLFHILHKTCHPDYKGYATVGHWLGNRKRFGMFC